MRSERERYIVRFTVDGEHFIQVYRRESDGSETTTRGGIELDESANPKQMTMKVSSVSSSEGPRVPGRIPSEVNAIYKLDEKGLTRRNGNPDRPTEFDDKAPGQILFTRHHRREASVSSVRQATSEKQPTNEGAQSNSTATRRGIPTWRSGSSEHGRVIQIDSPRYTNFAPTRPFSKTAS